jgi:hypothetical protein
MRGQYLKLYTDFLEDSRIAVLTDSEFRLVMTIWVMAKRQKPQGGFASVAHLKALIPQRLHRHLKALLSCGLIKEEGGRLVVDNWAKFQVDPTATLRQQRHRERSVTGTDRSDNAHVTVNVTPSHGGRLETGDRRHETRDMRLNSFNKPETIANILKRGLK